MSFASETMQLKTPHIPLGISVDEATEILDSFSLAIEESSDGKERFYRISSDDWECGFYEEEGKVSATWYNDPLGRESDDGMDQKVTLYLARYGEIEDWQEGINNGWIQFFNNREAHVGMAYGLHKDVIRFNYFG